MNINKAASLMGRKGGKAGTGKAKARTREQAQRAVAIRWEKYRKQKEQGKDFTHS